MRQWLSVLLSASIFFIVYITAAAQSRELFFHRILFPKSSWRKVKQASQVQQNKSLKGKK